MYKQRLERAAQSSGAHCGDPKTRIAAIRASLGHIRAHTAFTMALVAIFLFSGVAQVWANPTPGGGTLNSPSFLKRGTDSSSDEVNTGSGDAAVPPGSVENGSRNNSTSAGAVSPGTAQSMRGASDSYEGKKLPKGSKELLWKIESKTGMTLYLLGTIHVFKPGDYPLPEEMEQAFKKSRALIVEVDVTKSDPEQTKAFIMRRGVYPVDDNLTQHISYKSIKLLQDYCSKRQIPFGNLVRMRPWIVALTVLQVELARLGYDTKSGIDLHFLTQAGKLNKQVISLESMDFQMNLFADLADDLQEQDLELSLVDLDKLQSDAGGMMSAWKEGNPAKMDEIMTRDVKEHPELAPVQEKILYARNTGMAQKLDNLLKTEQGSYLVAIGAGHLVGNRSVIELLKKRGYTVTQIAAGDSI